MDPRRFHLVMSLFQEASGLGDEEREALLDERCGDDIHLRSEVEALLVHDGGGMVRTGGGAVGLACEARHGAGGAAVTIHALGRVTAREDPLPVLKGQYRILRVLGRGSMGTVYEAEQLMPRRLVALKAIRPGLATRQMLDRFQQEAHILGQMHHPGIAQIYDAGTAEEDGTTDAYLAMELVHGKTLTGHAWTLALRDRLRLMAAVCDAVHHAHQRGVIHRDLKPSNILVECGAESGSVGQPKVLDFGVARVVGSALNFSAVETSPGQLIGTLAYMSPEQMAGDPAQIDVRSDVYALGVVLFEAISGRLPIDLHGKTISEAVQAVREHEAPMLGTLDDMWRGEVETIVAKAVAKESSRRYQSAADLGADLRRYLAGEPIEAKRGSRLYLVRKQVARHWRTLGAVLAAMLGLLGFGVYASIQAGHNRALAERERRANDELSAAVVESRAAHARVDQHAVALRQSLYVSRIHAAQAALGAGDGERMSRALAECDADQRGWEWRYLWARADQSARRVECFPVGSASMSLAQHAGGTGRVYATHLDGHVCVLDALSGEVVMRFDSASGEAITVHAADPLGELLATGTLTGRIVIYSCADGQEVAEWAAHGASVRAIQFLADGRTLLTAGDDGAVRLWNVVTQEPRWELPGERDGIGSIRLTPDETMVATGRYSGSLSLWDIATGSLVRCLDGHEDTVLAIAFSADGRFMATGGIDRSVRVWETATGRAVSVSRAHSNKVLGVAIDSAGEVVASGGTDSVLRLSHAITGREIRRLLGHATTITSVAFTPDEQGVITGSRDGTVRWWANVREDDVPVWWPGVGHFRAAAFSPDGSSLAVGGAGPGAVIAKLRGRSVALPAITAPASSVINGLTYASDGARLYAACVDGTVAGWDSSTGDLVQRWNAHTGETYAVAASPVDERLASSGEDNVVAIWARPGDPEPLRLLGHTGLIPWVGWSGDGTLLVSTSIDGTVRVWSSTDGASVRTLRLGEGRPSMVYGAVFADQGRLLVAGTESGLAHIWDTRTWEHVGTLKGHKSGILCLAVDPSGERVATGSFDTTVRIWDVRARTELLALNGHAYQVFTVKFSPDGTRLISGGGDQTARFWNVREGE